MTARGTNVGAPAHAARSALAAALLTSCLLAAAPADAQRLGRLFFSAEERQALEEARREFELGGPVEQEAVDTLGPQEDEDPVVSRLTINGVVLRSSGVNSTWVNGAPVVGGMTREGLRVQTGRSGAGGDVRITLPSGVETVRLRPGQKIDVVSGSVLEVYQRDATEEAASAFEDGKESADADPVAPGSAPEAPGSGS